MWQNVAEYGPGHVILLTEFKTYLQNYRRKSMVLLLELLFKKENNFGLLKYCYYHG
jgi:hypothetical protein